MTKEKIHGYYFITDADLSRAGNTHDVSAATGCGVSVVQYRSQLTSTAQMVEEAQRLKKLSGNALFLINDRVDVALAADAGGVHLGQSDMPLTIARKLLGHDRIIGVTVHSLEEAQKAEKDGADYLGVAPIFATTTKKDAGKPAGIALVKQVADHVSLPVAAIGGITAENARAVIEAGASAICAISAVVTQPDIVKPIKLFQEMFQK